ncbi:uncharacterized protein LOC114966129 [Acropora millepora]|uniref:uncharacterized protein LOC114966129 n=1 Tax=Acropora millepora TaxID=45264 RepID=UPI001CF32228|nr:uncharacterized protein LOC114966129 [Acropora millepora]XP_029201738.2 uncharacterized protein LOC114966129 [Acropora millepora]XP_029201740.2 uncharacterized protein LOC114966129 [Acropora millepora]XP_044177515.1 uncharacterized protein LOC114966129 [Acropora millepora]
MIHLIIFGCVLFVFGTCAEATTDGSCDLKTQCLNDAVFCLSGRSVSNHSQGEYDKKLKQLEQEIATLKVRLANAGKPGGFATLDNHGRLPRNLLSGGFDRLSAFDLAWQSLHMAAAAACRGSTATGGGGCCENRVMVRNKADRKTCGQICAQTPYSHCDGEVSVYGKEGKATKNGEFIGAFYNYGCNWGTAGGSEASDPEEYIMGQQADGRGRYFGFCCCRK